MTGIFLVGGSPSSGSTLLVDRLNLVDGILGLPETGLFSHGSNLTDLNAKSNVDDISWTVPWLSTKAKVAQALGWRGARYDTIISRYKNAFELLRSEIDPGFSRWLIEKTPENIFAFRRYLEASPSHRIVVTSRDALSVTQSLMRRGFTMVESLLSWFGHTLETVRLLRDFPTQVHHCRYCVLTNDPRGAVEAILYFWSIAKPPQRPQDAAAPIDSEETRRLRFLAGMATQNLAASAWRADPRGKMHAATPTNLIGIRFDVLMDTIIFKTRNDGFVSPRTIDRIIAGEKISSEIKAAGDNVEVALMSWRNPYLSHLASNYTPHVKKDS